MSLTCELVESYEHKATYYLVSRDDEGNEIECVACCFEHGIVVVDTNHDTGHPLPDCVITPANGIRLNAS